MITYFVVKGFSSARSSSRSLNKNHFDAKWAIDGTTKYPHPAKYLFLSAGENYPWLELTMPEGIISGVEIVTRYDCCASRFKDIEIRAGMDAVPTGFKGRLAVNTKLGIYPGPAENGYTIAIKFGRSIAAKYVTLQRIGQGVTLEVNEVRVLRSTESEDSEDSGKPKPSSKLPKVSKLRKGKGNLSSILFTKILKRKKKIF